MNKKEFEEKYVNNHKVVHCNTQEKAVTFLRLAYDFGYKWREYKMEIKANTLWETHSKDTCYDLKSNEYCVYHYYRDNGYTIVEFDVNDFVTPVIQPIENKINRWVNLCNILGVKLDEEFTLNNKDVIYKINLGGLFDRFSHSDFYSLSQIQLNALMESTIKKLPFKPKQGDVYYYPTFHYKDRQWDSKMWHNREVDTRILNLFGCYRTKEEAENKAKELWGI